MIVIIKPGVIGPPSVSSVHPLIESLHLTSSLGESWSYKYRTTVKDNIINFNQLQPYIVHSLCFEGKMLISHLLDWLSDIVAAWSKYFKFQGGVKDPAPPVNYHLSQHNSADKWGAEASTN